MNAPDRAVSSRLLRHALALAAGEGLVRCLAALAWIVLARALGTEALGALEFVVAIVAYGQIATIAGLDWSGIRRIARGEPTGPAVEEFLPLRLGAALAGLLVLFCMAPVLPRSGLGPLLAAYAFTLPVAALNPRWAFLAEERGIEAAAASLLGQGVFLAGVVLGVSHPEHLGRLPALSVLSEATTALFLAVRLGVPVGFRRPWSRLGRPLREAVPIGLTQLVGQAIFNADVILLGYLGPLDGVGKYSAAYRVVTWLQVFPNAAFTAIFPALARHEASRNGSPIPGDRRLAVQSAEWSLALTLPVALAVFVLAEDLVRVLFGATFAGAVPALRCLVWSLPIVSYRAVFRQLLLAGGQELSNLALASGTAALNIGLNLVLIPRFGLLGAAAATIVSETALFVGAAARVRSVFGRLGLARPALEGIAAGAVALLLATSIPAPGPRVLLVLAAYPLARALSRRVWTTQP